MSNHPIDDLLRFPAGLVPGLPASARFRLQHHGIKEMVTFRSHEVAIPDLADGVTFDGLEVALLVRGVECGRVWPPDLAEWIRRKRVDPSFRLTRAEALGDVVSARAATLTFGQVLGHLGLTLIGVEVTEDEAPRPIVQAA